MTPIERRTVSALALIYALRMFGLFMVLPVLALFASDYQDATASLIGVAIGAYGLTQAILQLPFGVWSDRIGRKPVILIGLAIFTLGSALCAMGRGDEGRVAPPVLGPTPSPRRRPRTASPGCSACT